MAVHDYKSLKAHLGHSVQVVTYGVFGLPYSANAAIECTDCNEVLVDFDNDEDGGQALNKRQRMYLSDTIAILIDYDGYKTPEGLKQLIDETRKRLLKLGNDDISDEDLGV